MTDTEARDLLRGHEVPLRECVNLGFNNFRRANVLIASDVQPSSRTLSNLLHDSIVRVARERLNEPMRYVFANQRNLFVHGEKALLQFKRIGPGGKPSNYPTLLAREIEETGFASLPGLEPLPLLTVGYEVPETHDRVMDVMVLRVSDRGVNWKYSIYSAESTDSRMLFLDELTESEKPAQTKVRAKLPDDTNKRRSADSA